MNPVLLSAIADLSEKTKSPQYPHGYAYIEPARQAELQQLAAGGLITLGGATAHGFPVMLTDAGVKFIAEGAAQPHLPAAQFAQPQQPQVSQPAGQYNIVIEDNIAPPEARKFGPQTSGVSAVDSFPFGALNVGQSFFLPQDAGATKPKHRTFSSTVSQANKKHHPKNFVVREDTKDGVVGARVFRLDDLTGPRPTRARSAPAAQPAAQQPQQQFAPQQHMPAAPQFDPTQQHAPFAGPGFTNHGGAAAQQGGFGAPPAPVQGFEPTPPGGWQAPGGAPGFAAPPAGGFGGFPALPE